MRKMLGFAMIFGGTVFSVFIFNILLYTVAPAYKNVLTEAVRDNDIPVVEAGKEPVVMVKEDTTGQAADRAGTDTKIIDDNEIAADATVRRDNATKEQVPEETATTTEVKEDKPQVIDKEYHEDCGTGEGYWVITYSDGSVGLE